jgi:hypothetical protein
MRTSTTLAVVVLTGATIAVAAGILGSGTARAATGEAALESAAAPVTRDPLQWPFARTSIWNTPIGTKARYVPAMIRSTGFGVDVDWFVVAKATDPAVPVYLPATSGEHPCRGTRAQHQGPGQPEARRTQHLPRSFVLPDAISKGNAASTPHASSAFLQPDGTMLVSYDATARCEPGGPLYGRWSGETSLYGDGIRGGHGGSAMSSIGGSIRTGELTGTAPIRHALKLDVWSRYLFYDPATGGKRWPAVLADRGAAQEYTGIVKALRMGALLALPPSATAESLGVRSAAGKKVLAALRDYGGYVVDDSGLDAVDLGVEHRASVDFRRRTGHALEADAGLRADMARMVRALAVVDDNTASSIGGHGVRRARWAPPFRAPGSPAPRAVPAAGAPGAVIPRPSPSAIATGQVAQLEPIRSVPAPVVGALAGGALALLALGLWSGRRVAGGRRGL